MTNIITPKMNNVKLFYLNVRKEIYTKEVTLSELKKFLRETPDQVSAIYPIWPFAFTQGGVK